jgi:hypothetical protein
MVLESFTLVAVLASAPAPAETKPSAAVSAYDAVIATDEAPTVKELTKPAVLENRARLIVTVPEGRKIA